MHMNVRVVYYSRGGSTRKVADVIAQKFDQNAVTISASCLLNDVDLLFLGSGVYGGKAGPGVKEFISTLDSKLIKNAAVFGTCGGDKKAIDQMRELLKAQGINVLDESFLCRGKVFGVFFRKRPDENELKNAGEFTERSAQSVIKN